MITSDRAAELFNDSLERCTASDEFLDRFYELFLTSSREVAEKFRHTDFPKQKRMLKASLYMMILMAEGKSEIQKDLQRIAKRHSRADLDIRAELYSLWLDCLIQAAREFDPRFTPETEMAWRRGLHLCNPTTNSNQIVIVDFFSGTACRINYFV